MTEIIVSQEKILLPNDEFFIHLSEEGKQREEFNGQFERGTYCFNLSNEHGTILKSERVKLDGKI